MRQTGSGCVDCGLPCLGLSCPNHRVTMFVCDDCGKDGAEYIVDGDDLCEECASARLDDAFHELPMDERANLVEVTIKYIE